MTTTSHFDEDRRTRSLHVRSFTGDRATWDVLAVRFDASVRGSAAFQRAWAAKRLPRVRLRRFVLADEEGTVGLCAVALDAAGGRFLDRLTLDPHREVDWSAAMTAVLEQLPPGRYTYGWEESLEQPRQTDLGELPGVVVSGVRSLAVHVVELGDWPTWAAYEQSVSENVRRNVKKAKTRLSGLRVRTRTGRAAIRHVRALVRLRTAMSRRKGLPFHGPRALVRTAGHVLSDPKHSFVTLVHGDGEVLAALRGVRFGRTTQYAEGGSAGHTHGASWYLLMSVLEDAYRHDPRGRLVMGYVDHSIHDEALGGGLLRQRRSCRASEVETSIVTFDWAGRNDR